MLRRARFRDVVATQLHVFAEDEAELLAEAVRADDAWSSADRDESEELYGDYQLVVDAIAERLYDAREAYARTLDEQAADEYRATFNRLAAKRFGGVSSFLE